MAAASARWPTSPIRWARWSKGGCDRTGCGSTRVRVPLGVIGIIYENRPNVTSDAAGLCLKSGNAALLRGSSAAIESNTAIVSLLRDGLAKAGLPEDAVGPGRGHQPGVGRRVHAPPRRHRLPHPPGRAVAHRHHPGARHRALRDRRRRQLPRLRRRRVPTSTWPRPSWSTPRPNVPACATRPSRCSSTATVAAAFLPRVARALGGVELVGDRCHPIAARRGEAGDRRGLRHRVLGSRSCRVAVVDDLDEAIDQIARFGTGHSEVIITDDLAAAGPIHLRGRRCGCGGQCVDPLHRRRGARLGGRDRHLHAETSARGPMGLRELTSIKYVVHGQGQVRR